jgi:ubiquinone biosynthesis protein UbiJ
MPSAFPEISPRLAAAQCLLDAQPAALSRLQRHVGKSVRLALPVLPLDLSLDENGRFRPQARDAETEPALILTPMPSALPLLLGDGKLADLFRVEGDGLFASDISGALADFDWVLALRPWLGDIAASRVDQFLRGIACLASTSARRRRPQSGRIRRLRASHAGRTECHARLRQRSRCAARRCRSAGSTAAIA